MNKHNTVELFVKKTIIKRIYNSLLTTCITGLATKKF